VPDGSGRACLDAAIEEVEAGDSAIRRRRGLGVGRSQVALTARRSADICLVALPGAARLKRDEHARQADATAEALALPGHSVAALSLRSILAENGVLERLKARGYEVRTPE